MRGPVHNDRSTKSSKSELGDISLVLTTAAGLKEAKLHWKVPETIQEGWLMVPWTSIWAATLILLSRTFEGVKQFVQTPQGLWSQKCATRASLHDKQVFLYPSGDSANMISSFLHAIPYTSTVDRLKQISKPSTVKKKSKTFERTGAEI